MITKIYQSLYARLSLSLALIFIVFAWICVAVLIHSSRNYEKEVSQQMHRELAQYVVDHYVLFKDGKPDLATAEHTFHDLMIFGPNFEFYLLDTDGNILAFSAKPDVVQRKSVATSKFENWREGIASGGYIANDDPRNPQGEKIFSVAPITQDGQHMGYLYAVIGSQIRDSLEAQLSSSRMLNSGVTILGIGFLFTLLVILLLVAWITRPLAKLTHQVRQIRQAGFAKNGEALDANVLTLSGWKSESHNDVEVLGHTLALALEKLQQQYKNVVSIDDLRKELLSHVSHDLRTPLASLLGYLETWEMRQENITREQSSEFISIAKRSAQKISSLVEQLFELAHLDGDNVQVNIEPFSIAELIQDVLQKFSLQAGKKRINLSVSPQDSSISVRADIEKMERVFTNLIENALRHTPEGGSIVVKICQDSSFVSIQISDTGIGIPEQDIPFIFNAHFKAGNSIRENTAHGGLGLAITKKLLDLHESAIRVKSKIDQGTTFSFALPSA